MGPNGDNCEQGVELGWGPLFPKDRCELEGCGNQRTSRLDCGPAEALLAGTEESTSHMITENHVSEEAVTLVAKGVIMGMSTRIHSLKRRKHQVHGPSRLRHTYTRHVRSTTSITRR